ncbi:MAG: hypothetical protein E7234_05980 [Lachnospiraceae bacterium]|nr:hypothetical protein [Lachnospiraceae bacterium]
MNFKEQIEQDIEKVFHNSSEFADTVEFYYGENRYKVPVILDYTGSKDRKRPSADHAEGLIVADLVMYISFKDMKIIPKRGRKIEIGYDIYKIVKVEHELGEIILSLEMLDE